MRQPEKKAKREANLKKYGIPKEIYGKIHVPIIYEKVECRTLAQKVNKASPPSLFLFFTPNTQPTFLCFFSFPSYIVAFID